MSVAPSTPGPIPLGDAEFVRISELVQHHFGIQLPEAKRPLVQQRLGRLLVQLGCSSFTELCQRHVGAEPTPEILGQLVDRISTNHTYFWRESKHFEHLRDVVFPELREARARERDVRIWCAAAATGEEPWTLAMLVTQAFGNEGWAAGILATDISARALAVATRGEYRADNVAHLPATLRQQWFVPTADGDDATLSIRAALRREVTFRRLNLVGGPLPFRHPFDVVFCRNVMIYFSDATRKDLLRRIAAVVAPGGYLYVGHSETLGRDDPKWRFVKPGVYRRSV